MLQRIKVNLDLMEAMLYYWQATNDKEKVSEKYLNDVSQMPGLVLAYDNEFNAESVRKVLSAITNREPFSSKIKKESRFWNNNMWMMEDLSYTNSIIQPLKKLNLEHLLDSLNSKENCKYDEIEIVFSPLHFDEYLIRDNKIIINFFKLMPDSEGKLKVGELNIDKYIEEKISELL